MAHLLRRKELGISGDFSGEIRRDDLVMDEVARYGLNSQVSAVAYDPVQSLLAIGTNQTKFGDGQIHVFGQGRVNIVFNLSHKASVRSVWFNADKLISFDSKNDISVWSLETYSILSTFSPPGIVSSICCDPAIDYMFLGLQTGDLVTYDLDRGKLAPFRLPNFWREFDQRSRAAPAIALALHPRDIGTLLIGYAEGAVIFSIKQNKPIKFFKYEVPRGAPGGDANPAGMNVARHPRLTHAVWHPTGTFILTGHEDGSLVFWDAVDGRIVMARTLTETNINQPSASSFRVSQHAGMNEVREPIFKIVWCANSDPEDTAILVCGGSSSTSPVKGLTLFELGRTPIYTTSSWQVLSQYLASPKRQRMLPVPPGTDVVDICLIPRDSPHFSGAHDPLAMIALLGSGELITMSFPSGFPVTPTNQLHVSVTFAHPFITMIGLSPMQRSKWLGMTEIRKQGPLLVKGGKETSRKLQRSEARNIVQTAHADGTIRLWDAGHGDEIENESIVQVDVDGAIGRHDGVQISHMSLAGDSGELAVGLRSGEVAVFQWGQNRNAGRDTATAISNVPGQMIDISGRADPALSNGLLPFTMVDMQSGSVTALRLADTGFLAAGFENGTVIVVDLRGPAIIFKAQISELVRHGKKDKSRSSNQKDWATCIEYSVMTLDGDSYSSILLHLGTNSGHVVTFQILPEQGGRYAAKPVGVTQVDDGSIIKMVPIQVDGSTAYASQEAVATLKHGARISGVLVAVSTMGVKMFRPPDFKADRKSWDRFFCCSAAVTYNHKGVSLVVLGDDGVVRAYTLPGLREITGVHPPANLDRLRLSEAVITPGGEILAWTGPAEVSLMRCWGYGESRNRQDVLYNDELLVPPRPTISNVQWITGTQYVTAEEMDLLIGGPDRPPSKRMLEETRRDRLAQQGQPAASSSGPKKPEPEGYWNYMTKQIAERTERLGNLQEGVGQLEETSAAWANEASKFVKKQKQNLVMGAVKSKFGI